MKVASLTGFTFQPRKTVRKCVALVECQIVNLRTPEVHLGVVLFLRKIPSPLKKFGTSEVKVYKKFDIFLQNYR